MDESFTRAHSKICSDCCTTISCILKHIIFKSKRPKCIKCIYWTFKIHIKLILKSERFAFGYWYFQVKVIVFLTLHLSIGDLCFPGIISSISSRSVP